MHGLANPKFLSHLRMKSDPSRTFKAEAYSQ